MTKKNGKPEQQSMFTGPTIVLPPPPDYIVLPREGSPLPPDIAEDLLRLGRDAASEPWKLEAGQYSGEDWHLASFGVAQKRSEDGKCIDEDEDIHLTTDRVRCSDHLQDARDDAEWCVAARKLLPKLCGLLFEKVGRRAKATPVPPGSGEGTPSC